MCQAAGGTESEDWHANLRLRAQGEARGSHPLIPYSSSQPCQSLHGTVPFPQQCPLARDSQKSFGCHATQPATFCIRKINLKQDANRRHTARFLAESRFQSRDTTKKMRRGRARVAHLEPTSHDKAEKCCGVALAHELLTLGQPLDGADA